jgi:Arc/MetJ-type ribon-helix-helix transcriptional regulator
MKLSVSLPLEDVEFLDSYASAHGVASRSAAMRHAVRALREAELNVAYQQAFAEWGVGEDEALWDSTTADSV